MRDPFGPIKLTAEGTRKLYEYSHDCNGCLCKTCEGNCFKFFECLNESIGYQTSNCRMYKRISSYT